jgi:hypothetical protein
VGALASLWGPSGIVVLPSGDAIISDTNNHRVRRLAASTGIITTVAGTGTGGFSGDGGPATSAALKNPRDSVFDAGGNLFIYDSENNRIRRLAAGTGVITTVVGTGSYGGSLLVGINGDGGPGTSARLGMGAIGVAADAGGNHDCDAGTRPRPCPRRRRRRS